MGALECRHLGFVHWCIPDIWQWVWQRVHTQYFVKWKSIRLSSVRLLVYRPSLWLHLTVLGSEIWWCCQTYSRKRLPTLFYFLRSRDNRRCLFVWLKVMVRRVPGPLLFVRKELKTTLNRNFSKTFHFGFFWLYFIKALCFWELFF